MADRFSKTQRSQVMRQVKSSRNKSTELKLIEYFKAFKIIGWRRNYPAFGKPDFVFLKEKKAVFVDGCFWHGHDCRKLKPSNNAEYWSKKISTNRVRDIKVTETLSAKGWEVIRIWECQLKDSDKIKMLLAGSASQ